MRNDQLIVQRNGEEDISIPLAEIRVLVIGQPRVSLSAAVLSTLLKYGNVAVICDEQFLPAGMMLPLVAHTTQTERIAKQIDASVPTKKRVWKQIVVRKIRMQAECLRFVHGDDFGLSAFESRVRSGDPDNMEAQAAAAYWPLLFQRGDFRRRRDAPDQNRLLNYGYAVLRAITGRAICAAGLHPSIGLHHHNRYDPFCLASDLMEPYRPFVDREVATIVGEFDPDVSLDKACKARLITSVTRRLTEDGESRSFFEHVARTAVSLARIFEGRARTLRFPTPGTLHNV